MAKKFDEFKSEVERTLRSIADFELQEYHYQPSSFGNGILVLRIRGVIHKFVFDGRENELIWFVSPRHSKYFGAKLSEFKKIEGLVLTKEDLESGIEKSTQQSG